MRFIAQALITATTFVFISGSTLSAQSAPIERDAVISDTSDFPRAKMISLIDPAVGMIRARGWRCDSISAIRPFMFSRGFTVTCNHFNYKYDLSDKGGNWVVELK